MTKEELAHELVCLDAKISTLTTIIATLMASFGVRTDDGKNFSEFLAELAQKLPKGYTKTGAAVHDGKYDALTDLSRMIDRFSKDGKMRVEVLTKD